MNALVVVVDRLHAGYVGAYGNTWIETPAIDQLAVDGCVFDQHLIDSPRLEILYRAWWQGLPAVCPPESRCLRSPLPELISCATGAYTALLTDEPAVLAHPAAASFREVVAIGVGEVVRPADQVHQTHFAACFARIVDWLESARHPFFLWCHLAGFGTAWDAPLAFRRRFVEPGDPTPPESSDVPLQMLPEGYDPDELLGVTQSYSGQVLLLDTCLGALCEFLDTAPAGRETLLVFLSARGFPLGEHRRVGDLDGALYGELVHVPLIVRLPDRTGAATRSQALTWPADLWGTLADWWDAEGAAEAPGPMSLLAVPRGDPQEGRDRLCLSDGAGQRAIRTPAWYLRHAGRPELYAKPDDRWEVNDVADRCPHVVEPLQAAIRECESAWQTGTPQKMSPLDDLLLDGPQ